MITDLKENDIVATYLQVEEGQLFGFRNKQGKYAIFTFTDKSGSIKGVCWDRGEEYYKLLSDGQIVYVNGKTVIYNGQHQITVDRISTELDSDCVPTDFLPSTTLNTEEMYEYLLGQIAATRNVFVKQLLESFFADPEFAETFKKSPAAKSIHHSYLGGLLEHTTNCLKLSNTLCDIYPQLDRDVLNAGVMMHDMGKTVELSYDEKMDYTDEGRLLGHIVLGHTMILDHIRAIPNFPINLSYHIQHLIISHHGENATGSPKRPKTPEACALHYLENLDAQTKRFIQIVEDTSNFKKDSDWTAYDRLLERYLYRKPADEEQ